MIIGLGTDALEIDRMGLAMKRRGEGFERRVFTEAERQICSGRAFPASAFALRFAAKEAFSKALGLGMRRGLRWRDIEV